ncbi:MAG TPA: hypothetical protein VFA26_11620 [Gemmataceae bacterium]|nr:hypothetical protein [Gemmataceae bacterium]
MFCCQSTRQAFYLNHFVALRNQGYSYYRTGVVSWKCSDRIAYTCKNGLVITVPNNGSYAIGWTCR